MSELENKAVDILDKLEKLTTQFAPEVTDAAFAAIQISAANSIVSNILVICFGICFCVLAIKSRSYCLKMYREKKEEGVNRYDNDWDSGAIILPAALSAIGGVMLIVGIIHMFDIWTYVAIYDPRLALAHKILGL